MMINAKEIQKLNKLIEKRFGFKNLLKEDQTPTEHNYQRAKAIAKELSGQYGFP